MKEAAIVVDSIRYSYGAKEAVKGISFEVAPGEILGFLGPNGAGKSTTIKMLTGQLKPASGSIRILGMPLNGHNPDINARIGVSFEEKNLYLQMSAEENLRFFARLYGIKRLDIAGLLDSVGLLERMKDRVSSFSKGMRQRLMIARALVNDPEVLFLDEPTDGLDPVSAIAIRRIVEERAKKGTAIVLTTHDMAEADKLSHRVAFINEGKFYAVDSPEKLKIEHGKRAVRVRVKAGGEAIERSVPLGSPDLGAAIAEAVKGGELLTIHTEEASLEDIFVAMTGRSLA
jgi:ABC-2 type transport system ATP-binding protein